jgi:hypothetical protein
MGFCSHREASRRAGFRRSGMADGSARTVGAAFGRLAPGLGPRATIRVTPFRLLVCAHGGCPCAGPTIPPGSGACSRPAGSGGRARAPAAPARSAWFIIPAARPRAAAMTAAPRTPLSNSPSRTRAVAAPSPSPQIGWRRFGNGWPRNAVSTNGCTRSRNAARRGSARMSDTAADGQGKRTATHDRQSRAALATERLAKMVLIG